MAQNVKATLLKTGIAIAIGAILGAVGYASVKWHRSVPHDEDRVKAQIEERVKPLEKRIEELEKKVK